MESISDSRIRTVAGSWSNPPFRLMKYAPACDRYRCIRNRHGRQRKAGTAARPRPHFAPAARRSPPRSQPVARARRHLRPRRHQRRRTRASSDAASRHARVEPPARAFRRSAFHPARQPRRTDGAHARGHRRCAVASQGPATRGPHAISIRPGAARAERRRGFPRRAGVDRAAPARRRDAAGPFASGISSSSASTTSPRARLPRRATCCSRCRTHMRCGWQGCCRSSSRRCRCG